MLRQPSSLVRDISPPPSSRKPVVEPPHKTDIIDRPAQGQTPLAADVEASEAKIDDHLKFFASRHEACSRPTAPEVPRISIDDFRRLYHRNNHSHGRHFVVHQHDHPVSGVHYDLRVQFSNTSSISFAVPYGLPGNPNSIRPNRMAIETRVHCIWNNLIESASHATGSLLIWDTGEYEIIEKTADGPLTDDEESDNPQRDEQTKTDSEKLFAAFQNRHIKLRLHGSKLPAGYTISLRLPSANNRTSQPSQPKRKRRRLDPSKPVPRAPAQIETDSENEPFSTPETTNDAAAAAAAAQASGAEEEEDTAIRAHNAYPGAHNSINSIHQRHWFLTLDRAASDFHKVRTGPSRGRWVGPWEAFFVLGRDFERSVVTGRKAKEVMEDEGVEKFEGRKMWRGIVE